MLSRQPAGKKKVIFSLIFALLLLGVSVLLCEFVLRVWERRILNVRNLLDADPIDLGGMKFNETKISRVKPTGEFRILSFGDSFAYSIMSPQFSYAGLAATDLERRLHHPAVRIVNLGEGATTVRDYVAAHAFWAQRIDHDGALFNIYMGNDILDVAYKFTKPNWQPNHLYIDDYHLTRGESKTVVPHNFPLRIADYIYAMYATRTKMKQVTPGTRQDPRFNDAALHNLTDEKFLEINKAQLVNFDPSKIDTLSDGYRAVAAAFRYLSSMRRTGRKTLVVLSPNQVQIEPALRERIAKIYHLDLSHHDFSLPARTITAIRDAVDPQIELLDLSPWFACAGERGEHNYYLTNTHWGPEGNVLAARVISGRIAHSWFGQPRMEPDKRCDVVGYGARLARVDQTVIDRFVAKIVVSQ